MHNAAEVGGKVNWHFAANTVRFSMAARRHSRVAPPGLLATIATWRVLNSGDPRADWTAVPGPTI